jgi:cell division septal protein FtsQ
MKRRSRGEHVPYTDADRQYLRNRGNQRVRKRRVVRHTTRWTIVIAIHVIVIAALAFGTLEFGRRATRANEFELRTIRVEGLARVPDTTIDLALEPFLGANLLELDLDAVAEAIREEPWVEDVRIRRVLPRTLWITIEERTPVARIARAEGDALVDVTGELLTSRANELGNALPWIDVPERSTGDRLRGSVEGALRGLALMYELRPDWYPEVAKISIRRDAIAVYLHDGTRVLLDPDDPERNLDAWLRLRTEIGRRVGDAETIDLRWRGRISVLPASVESEHGRWNGSDSGRPRR